MKGIKIKEKEGSAIGKYIGSTSDILPKGRDMRSIADIAELYAISPRYFENTVYDGDFYIQKEER